MAFPRDRVFAQVAPNAACALLLKRIAYWHQHTRLERGGARWVAKTREQWAEDSGLSSAQVKRAFAALRDEGLIATEQHQFGRGDECRTPNWTCLTAQALALLWGGAVVQNRTTPGGTESHHPVVRFRTTPHTRDKRVRIEGNMGTVAEEIERQRAETAKKLSPEALAEAEAACARRPTSKAMEAVWRCSWVLGGHGYFSAWSPKQRGQARELFRSVGLDAVATALLSSAPRHWADLCAHWRSELGWQKVSAKPNLGLLLAGRDSAVEWAAGREAAEPQQGPSASEEGVGWDW